MDWRSELEENITSERELEDYFHWNLPNEDKLKLNKILERFPMSVSKYYLSLINPGDENDVIKKLCIPSINETDLSGSFDTSGEKTNTVATGLQHKYKKTALLLSTNKCAIYCRHCFRRRLVGINDEEINKHFGEIIAYIKEHTEINNVLITGGDAFLNSNQKIEEYLRELSALDHIGFIRFGTRTPVVLPSRIYGDNELIEILKKYSGKKTIYVITHYNHPKEITEESKKAVRCLTELGIIIKNQSVLLKGVNNSPEVMADLINKLNGIGVIPYYVFQCRPVVGVKNQFQVPLKEGSRIISETRKMLSGQGKCFRYVMSNERGKVEILGSLNDNELIFKYHEAKFEEDEERIFIQSVKDDQCWL